MENMHTAMNTQTEKNLSFLAQKLKKGSKK